MNGRDESDLEITVYRQSPLECPPIWIGYCCREWPMAYGFGKGRCGICGESPEFLRWDDAR